MHGVRSMKLASDSQQQAGGPTARTVSFSLAGNCDRPHHAAVWAEPNPPSLSAAYPRQHSCCPANKIKKEYTIRSLPSRTRMQPYTRTPASERTTKSYHMPPRRHPNRSNREIGGSVRPMRVKSCGGIPAPGMQVADTATLFCRSREASATPGSNRHNATPEKYRPRPLNPAQSPLPR